MNRRGIDKNALLSCLNAMASLTETSHVAFEPNDRTDEGYYEEPVRKRPIRRYDVVLDSGGTARMFSALADAEAVLAGESNDTTCHSHHPAGVIVLPRFWCRFLCRTGAFLSVLNHARGIKRFLPVIRHGRCDIGLAGGAHLDCIHIKESATRVPSSC